MTRTETVRRPAYTWRVFSREAGADIHRQIGAGMMPRCPGCRDILEARPQSRLCHGLPLDASGYDLDCRSCRRFFCVVRHTRRSLRLVRMRRFVAAIRAVRLPSMEPGATLPA